MKDTSKVVMSMGLFLGALVLSFAMGIGVTIGAQSIMNHTNRVVQVGDASQPCPSWISTTRSGATAHWSLTDCRYQDDTQSGGQHNVYVTVLDQNGAPISGATVHQKWTDGNIAQSTFAGVTNFAMGASHCDPLGGRPGALSFYIESPSMSDVSTGECMPLNRHVNFLLTFQWVTGNTATPTTTLPDLIPTPIPSSDYVTRGEFRALLVKTLLDILNGK